MTNREKFEKWYCYQYWNFKAENRVSFSDNMYSNLNVQLAWDAWQAGYNEGADDGHRECLEAHFG